MKKMGYLLSLVLIYMGVIFAVNVKFTSTSVTVEEYKQVPKELLGPINILPAQKAEKVYQYLFRSVNPDRFDAKKYLARHPGDGVVISYTGDGNEIMMVFSDKLPDKSFFRVARKK